MEKGMTMYFADEGNTRRNVNFSDFLFAFADFSCILKIIFVINDYTIKQKEST